MWVSNLTRDQDRWILARFGFACLWIKSQSRIIITQAHRRKEIEAIIQLSLPNKPRQKIIYFYGPKKHMFLQAAVGDSMQATKSHLALFSFIEVGQW